MARTRRVEQIKFMNRNDFHIDESNMNEMPSSRDFTDPEVVRWKIEVGDSAVFHHPCKDMPNYFSKLVKIKGRAIQGVHQFFDIGYSVMVPACCLAVWSGGRETGDSILHVLAVL